MILRCLLDIRARGRRHYYGSSRPPDNAAGKIGEVKARAPVLPTFRIADRAPSEPFDLGKISLISKYEWPRSTYD
jgi:hypothetical protein